MKLKIFAVRDAKAEAFGNPFFFKTHGESIRAWDEAVNDAQSPFYKHPNDYTLFEIGEFDQQTGLLTPLQQPIPHGSAFEFHRTNPQTTHLVKAVNP